MKAGEQNLRSSNKVSIVMDALYICSCAECLFLSPDSYFGMMLPSLIKGCKLFNITLPNKFHNTGRRDIACMLFFREVAFDV